MKSPFLRALPLAGLLFACWLRCDAQFGTNYLADARTLSGPTGGGLSNRLFLNASLALSPVGAHVWFVADQNGDGVPTAPAAGTVLGPDDLLLFADRIDGTLAGNQNGRYSRGGIIVPDRALTNAVIWFYLWNRTNAGDFTPQAGDSYGLYRIGQVSPPPVGNADWRIIESVLADQYTVGGGGGDTAPAITGQPQDQNVTAGGTAMFTVTATGNPPPAYQWRRNGTNLAGATLPMLSLTNVQLADAGDYSVLVSNRVNAVTSRDARLAVTVPVLPPTILAQPISLTVTVGEPASFKVTADGAAPLTFQWTKDQTNLAGATSDTYAIAAVTTNDAGSYTVLVSNAGGDTNSQPAVLTVNMPPPIQLSVTHSNNLLQFTWTGGVPPFQLLSRSNVAEGAWIPLLQTSNRVAEYTVTNVPAFFVIED